MLGWAAAQPQVPPGNAGLTAWLAGHGLRSGLAPYWEGSDVTVSSAGNITMLAIEPKGWHGALVAQKWQTDVALANPKANYANFVVVSPTELVTHKAVLETFGKPLRIYHYETDTILVWHRNLLDTLYNQPHNLLQHEKLLAYARAHAKANHTKAGHAKRKAAPRAVGTPRPSP
jgi:hypothetical protein